MRVRQWSAALALLATISFTSALSCTPCRNTTCGEVSCPGRTVRDVCGCCLVCARGLGEPCGGYFDSLGLCDDGLVCQTSLQHGQAVDTGAEGICSKNTTETSETSESACIRHVCQLMLEKCICTELSECRPPVPKEDPTSFHSRELCEEAAAARGSDAAVLGTTTTAPMADCPEEPCDIGATSCPADSVLKNSTPPRPDCCPPSGVCLCDLESCPRAPACPLGHEASLVTRGDQRPGTCCNAWECKPSVSQGQNCTHQGKAYAPGETWLSGGCRSCQCKEGVAFCGAMQCPSLINCTGKATHPPGECCPQCVDGCVSPSGVHHNNSEQWLEDDCTTCSCLAGVLSCHSEMCHISCRNPRHVPGRCCPVCDECEVMCQHGYRTARDGSRLCQCLTAEEAAAPPSQCHSMASCKLACTHGFKTDDNGCERCKCRQCRKLKDCTKNCPYGFETNERACDICKCRVAPETSPGYTGVTRPRPPSTCLTKDGAVYTEGTQWHDGCRQCICHVGQEMCAVIACPVPRCTRPGIAAGHCCPTCPDEPTHAALLNVTVCQSVDGRTYLEGQLWQLDPCTRCMCRNGRVLCGSPACPPAACQRPLRRKPDDCCATCAEASDGGHQAAACRDAAGVVRKDGTTWRRDACVSCLCRDGGVQCFHETCQPVDCARPVLKKGHCCPVCLEPAMPSSCALQNGTLMSDGLGWTLDACTSCLCQRGQTICSRRSCPEHCVNGEPPDPCCPLCKESEEDKRNHHLLDGVSKATHRTVVRPMQPPAQTAAGHAETDPGENESSNKYTVLWVVIGCLTLALVALLVGFFMRRHRRGYSPKPLTDEKRPLNDPQIMHFVRLDNRGVPHDTLVLEKNGDVVRET